MNVVEKAARIRALIGTIVMRNDAAAIAEALRLATELEHELRFDVIGSKTVGDFAGALGLTEAEAAALGSKFFPHFTCTGCGRAITWKRDIGQWIDAETGGACTAAYGGSAYGPHVPAVAGTDEELAAALDEAADAAREVGE